jgi:hypothetical protein
VPSQPIKHSLESVVVRRRATKDGWTYEIDAKCHSIFSGQPISPQEANKFFVEIRKHFNGGTNSNEISLLNITVKSRLPSDRAELAKIVSACNAAATSKIDVTLDNVAQIHFRGSYPYTELGKLINIVATDFVIGQYVLAPPIQNNVIVRLNYERKDRFRENIIATISESTKTQFTGTLPTIIWTHIDYIDRVRFGQLSRAKDTNQSFFDSVANAVFRSPKRVSVAQLVFTGGAFLKKDEKVARSSFEQVIYNSPNGKFSEPMLFSGGRVRRPT